MRALDRRELLALLTIGAAATLVGCGEDGPSGPTFPPPHPGAVSFVQRLPGKTMGMVLTVDDGADPETVAAYVRLAETTGLALTFNPNGMREKSWLPVAAALRGLIEKGQVQIANHTFHHRILVGAPDQVVREEVERNEDWIQRTFGVTSRPWLRPPDGLRDRATDAICGSLGFTRILLWNATFSDAQQTTVPALLRNAKRALFPGALVVGHANAPTVTTLFGQIMDIIGTNGLRPQTLDQAFGTSRRVG